VTKAASKVDEERFLAFIVRGWPEDDAKTSLDANAFWIGKKIGLTDDQTKSVVQALALKGFLHARNVEGVILVHPTKAGIERVRITPMGRVVHALKSFLGLPRHGK
jgi:hypothetical protein